MVRTNIGWNPHIEVVRDHLKIRWMFMFGQELKFFPYYLSKYWPLWADSPLTSVAGCSGPMSSYNLSRGPSKRLAGEQIHTLCNWFANFPWSPDIHFRLRAAHGLFSALDNCTDIVQITDNKHKVERVGLLYWIFIWYIFAKVVWCNHTAEKILGYGRDDMIGKDIREFQTTGSGDSMTSKVGVVLYDGQMKCYVCYHSYDDIDEC